VPEPTYPPFEIVFMQRPTANSPAYLYTHDFATSATPFPLARDSRGVSWYSWAPDGGRGLAILDGSPHLLIPGRSSRDLGDGFDSIAYAADSVTAYGIRSTLAGSNDRTELLEVDLTTEAVTSLTTWTYPHPITYRESPPVEAQFADDGGFERVYVLEDGRVVVWVLGAPATYTFDPGTGATGTLDATPTLWSPDGLLRAFLAESGSRSRIAILGLAGEERASLNVTGLVSHIRWSANSNQIAFTVTTTSSGGAVYQDLWAWDLDSDSAAARLTQDQRSLGAGYRGAREIWKP
jgi:hypothetical protein